MYCVFLLRNITEARYYYYTRMRTSYKLIFLFIGLYLLKIFMNGALNKAKQQYYNKSIKGKPEESSNHEPEGSYSQTSLSSPLTRTTMGHLSHSTESAPTVSTKGLKGSNGALFEDGRITRPITLWNQDMHISPIHDLKTLLEPMGVKFIDKTLSSHCHITKTCNPVPPLRVITQRNGFHLTPELISKFYESYKNDSEMKTVTAFVCYHPPAMCDLFRPFKKPLIIISSIRYELGRNSPNERWHTYNEILRNVSKDPRNVIGGNNLYDTNYIKYFTGIETKLIPSYCGYTNESYHPRRPEFLFASTRARNVASTGVQRGLDKRLREINSTAKVAQLRTLYGHYKYSDLANHPGIIHIPYQVSVMSLFEQYRMNIPLFVPSLESLSEWHVKFNLLKERTWDSTFGKIPLKSRIQGVQSGIPDPNSDRNITAVKYWLQFSDFYQWPHITYYNSGEHLAEILHAMTPEKLKNISSSMAVYNKNEQTNIKNMWKNILINIVS
ncbi:unnamed protein product [Owenia fusiformis]|uniref:Uncharacterized protein n=1 Tax=Owenia fusiformis TaxID=6347 RepID=A0A8J1UA97_OWEFU|nr:unnamed protein product [Owenia fusiformis]